MKVLICLVALFDFVFGHGHVLEPFFSIDLPNDLATLESVEYDSTNQLIFYQSFLEGIIYVADYDADEIEAGTFTLDSQVAMNNSNFTVEFPTGMYSDGTYLFVVSAVNGYVTAFMIETQEAIAQLEILYDGASTRLNGLCNDPTDDTILYVTSPGADFIYTGAYTNDSALYRVNITSGEYTRLVDFGGEEHPNGCAVGPNGDYVYMVSFWLDGSGAFLRYDVSDESYEKLSGIDINGDGIFFDNDDRLYFTSWGNTTTDGVLYEISGFASGSSVTYEEIATGMGSPADACYDSDNNWAVIPEFFGPPGAIAWVDLNDVYTTTMMDGNYTSGNDTGSKDASKDSSNKILISLSLYIFGFVMVLFVN